MSLEEVKQDYFTIFKPFSYEYQGKVNKHVWINDSLDTGNRYAEFNGKYGMYGSYVLSVFAEEIGKNIDADSLTETEYGEIFIATLRNDSLFNTAFLPIVGNYLTTKGVKKIQGYRFPPKAKIKMQEAMRCCSQFFYASRIKENGKIEWKICGGANGMNETGTKVNRNWALESFCFWAVTETMGTENAIMDYFSKQMTKIQTETAAITDPNMRVTSARKQMEEAMQACVPLQAHIEKCYNSNPSMWGFVLKK